MLRYGRTLKRTVQLDRGKVDHKLKSVVLDLTILKKIKELQKPKIAQKSGTKGEIKARWEMLKNEDLRKEIQGFKGITHDEWMEKLVTENDYLHTWVGELLNNVHELECEVEKLKTVAPQ